MASLPVAGTKASSLITVALLVVVLLPIEITRNPAPLSAAAIICPLLIDRRVVFSGWAVFICLVALFAILIGLGSAVYFDEFWPLFSCVSFVLPMSGFVLGAMYVKQPSFTKSFDRATLYAGALFAITLVISLVENGFVVRVPILCELSSGGCGYLLFAAAKFFGYPYFGVMGVNTFAGICLAFCFLLVLTASRSEEQLPRVVRTLSIITVLIFGGLLQSRAYFFGLIVFLLTLVLGQRRAWIKKVCLVGVIFCSSLFYVGLDSRLDDFFRLGGSGGLSQLTTNRYELWEEFLVRWNPLVGSAFQRLNFDFSDSYSYHNYLLTCAGKGGVVLVLLLAVILLAPFFAWGKFVRVSLRFQLLTAMHASFLVQAMVWDIYATQCYGHLAWFVCGACLSSSPVGWARLTEAEPSNPQRLSCEQNGIAIKESKFSIWSSLGTE